MKLLASIYKTKTLSEYGRFILIALACVLILGNIFIPDYTVQNVGSQVIKLKGKHFKYDDNPHVREFIRSVSSRDGYICLGTSESTTLRDGNYYEFLDQDTSYDTRFSILGGAGRSCGLHMPMLLNHKEEVAGLKLIYFINPVYWRSELNGFDKGYWTRYVNYSAYLKTLKQDENDLFAGISEQYSDKLNIGEKFLYSTAYLLRKIRKPFFQDLRYFLFPGDYPKDLAYLAQEKQGFGQFAYFGQIDTTYLDTSWNVSHEFMNRTWLNPMVDNDYRTQELKAFIELSEALGAEVTYILGPVNDIYIKKYHPPYREGYQNTLNNLRDVLQAEKADWIDLTHIGSVPGSFIDNQHHSSYGAYLIYRELKQHLYEKEDH